MISSLKALKDLMAALGNCSPAIVPAGQVNTLEPKNIADLPHLTISGTDIKETPIGIGGILLMQNLAEGGSRKLRGYKAAMTFRVDIWADSGALIEDITQKVTQFIFDSQVQMRGSGFVSLCLNSIGEVVPVSIRKTRTTYADAWKRRLEYQGIYEQILEETGSGRIINKPNISIVGRIIK